MKHMANSLYLFIFPSQVKALQVLQEGRKSWDHFDLVMDIWVPQAGCWGSELYSEGGWIRIFGLPVHL